MTSCPVHVVMNYSSGRPFLMILILSLSDQCLGVKKNLKKNYAFTLCDIYGLAQGINLVDVSFIIITSLSDLSPGVEDSVIITFSTVSEGDWNAQKRIITSSCQFLGIFPILNALSIRISWIGPQCPETLYSRSGVPNIFFWIHDSSQMDLQHNEAYSNVFWYRHSVRWNAKLWLIRGFLYFSFV